MKPLIVVSVLFVASFLYLDSLYSKELDRVYEYNKFVIESYCHPNGVN